MRIDGKLRGPAQAAGGAVREKEVGARGEHTATAAFWLGADLGVGLVWKARTLMHTLAMGDSAKLATCLAADIAGWLEDESCAVPLEVFEPEGRWRPATRALAAGPGPSDMLSVFQSATAFNINKRPM